MNACKKLRVLRNLFVILFCLVLSSFELVLSQSNYKKGFEYYKKQDYENAAKYYLKAAKDGDINAQYELGYLYDAGLGVDQDYSKAIKCYSKAAKEGNTLAAIELSCMYFFGRGTNIDYEEAISWAKIAEEGGGNINADMHKNINSIAKDIILNSKQKGNVLRSYSTLCIMNTYGDKITYILSGDGDINERNGKEYFSFVSKLAKYGVVSCQYDLGRYYESGYLVEKNYERAAYWYLRVVENESYEPEALNNSYFKLGAFYDFGYGVKKNYKKAVEYYEQAADNDHLKACYFLGLHYIYGNGVTKDYNHAKQLLNKVIENGKGEIVENAKRVLNENKL